MRKMSAFNAFSMEFDAVASKVGSEEHLQVQGQMSRAWKSLKDNPEELMVWQAKADEIQSQRDKLASVPVSATSAAGSSTLKASQIKRLAQVRLDSSILVLHQHPAWKDGLALSG